MIKLIYKIVITGGPCGGKSDAIPYLKKHFSEKGYKVITVTETATELIKSGITPKTFGSISVFQRHCVSLQLKREEIYCSAASEFDSDVIILFDRGALDGSAYTTRDQFNQILNSIGYNRTDLYSRYDAVFHMTSVSIGAENFYTTNNNSARTETLEEARNADNNTLNAWKAHQYHKIIDNSTDFNGKTQRLINEIEQYIQNQPR